MMRAGASLARFPQAVQSGHRYHGAPARSRLVHVWRRDRRPPACPELRNRRRCRSGGRAPSFVACGDEIFAVCRAAGDWTLQMPQDGPGLRADPVSNALNRASARVLAPYNSVLADMTLTHFELRLDQRDQPRVRGCELERRSEHEPEADEAHIRHDGIHRFANLTARQVARIDALKRKHAPVGPERSMQ